LLATATALQSIVTVMATPLPEEWPGLPATAKPQSVELPGSGSGSRPERPEQVPGQVAVGDLAPQGPFAPLAEGSREVWLHPLPLEAREQSPWGWRWSEARGTWRMHTGVDLIVTSGTPVLAARSGHVVLAEWVSGYGLTVLLDHGDGWQTLYAHLEGMEVRAGRPIARGERLGRVGDTGSASTPHLHLELRRRGEGGVMAVNPAALLEAPRLTRPVLAAGPGI